MTRAFFGLAISWIALMVGLFALGVSTLPGGGQYMAPFMLDHGLVILNLIVASMILRRVRSPAMPFRWPGARRLFAPWLIVTGCGAALALVAVQALLPVDLLLRSGQHLKLVSHAMDAASFPSAHRRSDEEFLGFFAYGWVVAAMAGMCMWHLISLRDAQARDPVAETMPGSGLDDGVDANGRLAFRRHLLIATIWAIAIAWSFGALSFGHFVDRRMCDAGLPWPFALLPALMFGVSGLFAKRAQYMTPWLSEMMDSRFGDGAYARFLVSLKPLLLLAVCGLIGGAGSMWVCGGASFVPMFLVSGAVGFALAHFIMRARRIEGV